MFLQRHNGVVIMLETCLCDTGVAGSLLKELGPTGLTLVPTVAVLVVIILALVITIIIIKYKHNKVSISIEGYGFRSQRFCTLVLCIVCLSPRIRNQKKPSRLTWNHKPPPNQIQVLADNLVQKTCTQYSTQPVQSNQEEQAFHHSNL